MRPDLAQAARARQGGRLDALLVSCFKAVPRSRDAASMLSRMQETPVYTVGVLQKDDAFRTMAPTVGVLRNSGSCPRRAERPAGSPGQLARSSPRPPPRWVGRLDAPDQGVPGELVAHRGPQGPGPVAVDHAHLVSPASAAASMRSRTIARASSARRPRTSTSRRRRPPRGGEIEPRRRLRLDRRARRAVGHRRSSGTRIARRPPLHLGPAAGMASTRPRTPMRRVHHVVAHRDGRPRRRPAPGPGARASRAPGRAAEAAPRRRSRARGRSVGRRGASRRARASPRGGPRDLGRAAPQLAAGPRELGLGLPPAAVPARPRRLARARAMRRLELGLARRRGRARPAGRLARGAAAARVLGRPRGAVAASASSASRATPLGAPRRTRGGHHPRVQAEPLGDAEGVRGARAPPCVSGRRAQGARVEADRRVDGPRRLALAHSFSSGWWVVASTSAPRSTRRAITAWASAAPSSGSVPAAGSSSSTSDRGPAASRVRPGGGRGPEKVDRLSRDRLVVADVGQHPVEHRQARPSRGRAKAALVQHGEQAERLEGDGLAAGVGARDHQGAEARAGRRSTGTAVPGRAAGGGRAPRSTSSAGSTGQPSQRARERAAGQARSRCGQRLHGVVEGRPPPPTRLESAARMRSTSSRSRGRQLATPVVGLDQGIGSTKSVSPEAELSWTMPGTAERELALTASTGRPPRSVVKAPAGGCAAARARGAAVSAAAARVGRGRRRSAASSGRPRRHAPRGSSARSSAASPAAAGAGSRRVELGGEARGASSSGRHGARALHGQMRAVADTPSARGVERPAAGGLGRGLAHVDAPRPGRRDAGGRAGRMPPRSPRAGARATSPGRARAPGPEPGRVRPRRPSGRPAARAPRPAPAAPRSANPPRQC